MNVAHVEPIIKVAKIHAERLQYAIDELANIFPLDAEKVQYFSQQELLLLELLTSRFTKLQDFMGSRIFDIVFDLLGEEVKNLAMIDKLNKLEKLQLLDDAKQWLIFRQLRNHLAHEYPEQPQLTAEHLNRAYEQVPNLVACLTQLIAVIDKQIGRSRLGKDES